MTVSVTDETFEEEVLNADAPVFVDFMATWCGPCRAMAPLVEQLAEEYDGKIKVVKLDIDDAPDTAAGFNIRGVPTFMLFNKGSKVYQWVGAQSGKAAFTEKFEEVLAE